MDEGIFSRTAHRLAIQHTPDEEALVVLSAYAGVQMTGERVVESWEAAKGAATVKITGIQELVEKYISVTDGIFSVTDCLKALQEDTGVTSVTRLRKTIRMALCRFKEAGKIRGMKRAGHYQRIDTELEILDWKKADLEPENLILPLGLSNLVEFYPGNIILVSGARNAGKTCFLLNVIAGNMHRYETHLFSSESGPTELKKRLLKFKEVAINDWKFAAYTRSNDFGAVIKPGRGVLNVIDFLEVYKDFYLVGQMIQEIWQALDGALAVCALQKPIGRDIGIGGELSLDKPRLAIALDQGTCKIVKAKAWRGDYNPNGLAIPFKIIDGTKLEALDNWIK